LENRNPARGVVLLVKERLILVLDLSVRCFGGIYQGDAGRGRCAQVPDGRGAGSYGPGESFIDIGQGHVHSARNEGSTVVSLYVMYLDVPPGVTSPFIAAENPGVCPF
jgi:hypothetical protein